MGGWPRQKLQHRRVRELGQRVPRSYSSRPDGGSEQTRGRPTLGAAQGIGNLRAVRVTSSAAVNVRTAGVRGSQQLRRPTYRVRQRTQRSVVTRRKRCRSEHLACSRQLAPLEFRTGCGPRCVVPSLVRGLSWAAISVCDEKIERLPCWSSCSRCVSTARPSAPA